MRKYGMPVFDIRLDIYTDRSFKKDSDERSNTIRVSDFKNRKKHKANARKQRKGYKK